MTVQIDTQGFDRFLTSLQQMSGASRQTVLLAQTAKVLELCVKRSPGKGNLDAREKAKLRVLKPSRYVDESGTLVPEKTNRVPRKIETGYLQELTGTRGGVAGRHWYVGRNKGGKRIFLTGERLARWKKGRTYEAVQSLLENLLKPKAEKAALAVGGLKHSWIDIGRKLGIDVKAPAWVKKCQTAFRDGARSRLAQEGAKSFVEIVNTNRALIKRYDGASILAGAIQTRLRAFQGDLARDVFSDLKTRAQRYPGIFVAA